MILQLIYFLTIESMLKNEMYRKHSLQRINNIQKIFFNKIHFDSLIDFKFGCNKKQNDSVQKADPITRL